MVLAIGSWFNEPGIEFRVSFKVRKLIRQIMVEDIMMPFGLEERDPYTFMRLVISTSIGTSKLEVRGPEYDKRNKTINYGLWLPYKKINESSSYLNEYLNNLFDALVILFKKYDVPEDPVRSVQKKVEKEVLNNAEYEYNE
ncbi:MAG TPA: hypothetical protein VIM89_10570 [Mucilaginibacter sp.]